VLGEQNYSSVKTQHKKSITPQPSSLPSPKIQNQTQRSSTSLNQPFNTTNLSNTNKNKGNGADFN
jgi:hypothetical protein